MADEDLTKKKPVKKKATLGKSTKKDKIDFSPTTDGTMYEAVLTIPQRMKRAMAIRRIEPKLKRSREVARRRMAGDKNLKKRSAAAAREIVRRKVAGDRGLRYQELSSSEKIQIDQMTEKRIKAIRNLAKKLYPRIKQAEQKRLASVLKGPAAVSEAADVRKLQKALGPEHRIVGHAGSKIHIQSEIGNASDRQSDVYNTHTRTGAKIIDRLRAAGISGAARLGSYADHNQLHTHIQIQESSDTIHPHQISSKTFKTKMDAHGYSGPYRIKYRNLPGHIEGSYQYTKKNGSHIEAVNHLKKMGYDHPKGSGYLSPGTKYGESGGHDSDGYRWDSTRLTHTKTGHTIYVHSGRGEPTKISSH